MKLCLGTVQFGLKYGIAALSHPDIAESIEIIESAIDNGVTALDTAANYGIAEEIIGKFVSASPSKRNKFEIATKTPAKLFENIESKCFESKTVSALEDSLKKLKCDYVDYYLLHNAKDVFKEEIQESMFQIQKRGLAKKVGVSVYHPEEALAAKAGGKMSCIQVPYNAIDRRLDVSGFFEGKKSGFTIFCRSVLLQGLLTMDADKLPDKLAFAKNVIAEYASLCDEYNLSRVEGAIGFVKHKRDMDFIIIGVDNLNQLKEQITIFQKNIPDQFYERLKDMFNNVDHRILNPALW